MKMKSKKGLISIIALVAVLAIAFVGYRMFFGVQKVTVDNTAQGKKIAEYAHPESFITPVQLKELMDKYFNKKPKFVPHGKYYVRLGGKIKSFPWSLKDWIFFDLIPLKDRIRLVKTLIKFLMKLFE